MMLTDTDRVAQVTCALGKNALVLYRMRGQEALGQLAHWDLELLADQSNLDIAKMLGSDFSLSLTIPAGGVREYNGIVTAFELARADRRAIHRRPVELFARGPRAKSSTGRRCIARRSARACGCSHAHRTAASFIR
jgi:hypothetical protein